MSLLDALNKSNLLQKTTSFTEQAAQMKAALSGKESASPAIQKSNIAEQVAVGEAEKAEQKSLEEAQVLQNKAALQSAEIEQQKRLTSAEYKQKEAELVSATQRQFNDRYYKLQESFKELDADKQVENLQQLTFLQDLTDRRYIDRVQIEGDKRRLDNTLQMKEALMYATFSDQIDRLNEDLEFKRMLAADNRTFNEMLAQINPEAALQAAIADYKSRQSEAAYVGMAKNISDTAEPLGKYAAENWNQPEPKPPESKT